MLIHSCTWGEEHTVVGVVSVWRSLKGQCNCVWRGYCDRPRNKTVYYKIGSLVVNYNGAFTADVIGLHWIKRCETDTSILCRCQGTTTDGSWSMVGKKTIQDNSSCRDAGLVAKGGHCNILKWNCICAEIL